MPQRPKQEGTAEPFLPERKDLSHLRAAAKGCTACDLHLTGAQTVFGEGPARALVMFVGEQPGDAEDRAGRPFVGPAGRILDQALAEAGVDRAVCYVTNAVKHFKWTRQGKRRLHAKPNAAEIRACRPWLESELRAVRPRVIVCLGATAAQALLGRDFRVTQHRGERVPSPWAPHVMATVHPSSILRAPTDDERHEQQRRFTDDLRKIPPLLRD